MSTPNKITALKRLITKAREINAEAADDGMHEKINDAGTVGEYVESTYKPTLQSDVRINDDGTGILYLLENGDTGETLEEGEIDFDDMPPHMLDAIIYEVKAVIEDISSEACETDEDDE